MSFYRKHEAPPKTAPRKKTVTVKAPPKIPPKSEKKP